MYDMEFRAALATSTIAPYHVKEVIAGWFDENQWSVRSGFVVLLRNETYAYITQHREKRRDYMAATTEQFPVLPEHLYSRGRRWEFDREKLNGSTEIAKQTAKYPIEADGSYVAPSAVDSLGSRFPRAIRNVLHGSHD